MKTISAFAIIFLLHTGFSVRGQSDKIRLNQIGFYTYGPKKAIVITDESEKFYVLSQPTNDTVFKENLGHELFATYSPDKTRVAEFSSLHKPGKYVILVPSVGQSYPFVIRSNIFGEVAKAAIKGFYYQRASTALPEIYAGKWNRPQGHADNQVLIHPSAATKERPAGTIISSPGGWYDAGDYNKYIVNSGITMGTLLSAYEDFPDYYDTLHTNIPPLSATSTRTTAALPDILNEALYNLRWMLTMQDPDDGGVYNKCTNAAFDGMVMPGVTKAPRYVVQKGTAATLNFLAVMAQAARILRKFPGPGLAD